jgi:GNAT superfamily N-acetyltransferase
LFVGARDTGSDSGPIVSDDPPRLEAFRIDRQWAHAHRLADGTEVMLRMLRPEDRESFLAGFERLSRESRYFRFFTAMPRLPESVLRRLLNTDGINHVALAAWRSGGGTMTEPIGVARFIRLGDGGDTAEAAVAVVDHMQGRGVGRLLLADLSEAARERGIRRFRAEVMLGNRAVAALLHELHANAKPVVVEDNIAVYELDLPGNAAERRADSILFRMLRLIARGLEVVGGRATSGTA